MMVRSLFQNSNVTNNYEGDVEGAPTRELPQSVQHIPCIKEVGRRMKLESNFSELDAYMYIYIYIYIEI